MFHNPKELVLRMVMGADRGEHVRSDARVDHVTKITASNFLHVIIVESVKSLRRSFIEPSIQMTYLTIK